MPGFFAGLDWASHHHDVAVLDDSGTLVAEQRVSNDADGLRALLTLLSGVRRRRRDIPIGIETGRGLMVAGLRAAGQPVVVLNPVLVARYRDRLALKKRKSDRTDAQLLAHVLRVDGAAHRQPPNLSEQAQAIRELARAQRRAAHDRDLLAGRLRSLLHEYFPGAERAWAQQKGGLTRLQARTVLETAPTPSQAARLSVRRLEGLLVQAGRTRLIGQEAERLYELFRTRTLRQPRPIEEAMGQRALGILAQLSAASTTAETLASHAAELFDAHPHAAIYRSFPGCGPLIGIRLLGEIGDDPHRFPDARALRAYAAAAPLTWASGTSVRVTHRRNANPVMAETGHVWAFSTLTRSPGARAYYDRRRAAGDRHAAALRRLYSRLLGQLHYCLSREDLYDEQRAYQQEPDDSAEQNQ